MGIEFVTIAALLSVLILQASGTAIGSAIADDGDSITISGERIRLFGIDAPELSQQCSRGGSPWPCGKAAHEQLSRYISGQEVRCERIDIDAFDRTIARCRAGEADLNRLMVAAGYAVAFRQYSSDYVSAEDTAKNARRGLWSGAFTMPNEVRSAGRLGAPSEKSAVRVKPLRVAEQSAPSCVIKGNRSRRGEWIYHLPGMSYYEQTRAEELFCSEKQARDAGYRRARAN